MSSARAAREAYDIYGYDEAWADVIDRETKAKPPARLAPVTLLVCLGLLAALWLMPSSPLPAPELKYTLSKSGEFLESLRKAVPIRPSVRLRDDFSRGIDDWIGGAGDALDWARAAGALRPGRLRLWKPTLTLTDYELEFESVIERKAMGWTYRSRDTENYYATKITLSKPGSVQGADIVRYVVINGRPERRVQLPLPVPIRQDVAYQVRMTVVGERFNTLVNGQLVDSWTDSRLKTGGVGFFTDKGESATLHWVSLWERKGMLGRLFASAFLIAPVDIERLAR